MSQVDIDYITNLMPSHYWFEKDGNRLVFDSEIGLDDEHWGYIVRALMQKFGRRLHDIFQPTTTLHKKVVILIEYEEQLVA